MTNLFLFSASKTIKVYLHKFNHFLSVPGGMGHTIKPLTRQRNQVNVQDIRFVFPMTLLKLIKQVRCLENSNFFYMHNLVPTYLLMY